MISSANKRRVSRERSAFCYPGCSGTLCATRVYTLAGVEYTVEEGWGEEEEEEEDGCTRGREDVDLFRFSTSGEKRCRGGCRR